MIIIDDIIVDFIHMLVPFLIYLFYIAYKKKIDDRENDVIMILTIFSSLYIILKYNHPIFEYIPMFLVNIPLMVSYVKKNTIAILMSSVVAIFYLNDFYHSFLPVILIMYIVFYILYKCLFKKIKVSLFAAIFTCIYSAVITILGLLKYNVDISYYFKIIFVGIVFWIIVVNLIILLLKVEDILKIKISANDIKYDKQLKTTLFHITHEIKNPIAVCKGYLDMMDPANINQTQKYIPIIKEEISKTLILLEDFLSMNRVKLNKDILDINYLLSDFLKNYKPYFEENKIKTDINITDDEIFINGDYNKLHQVLLNVIKNSIEALKENPMIKIWTKLKKDKFYIYIEDNGKGITKDVLDKIGEPFFTTKTNGTGLGVSLSKEIVEAHDGKMKYESIPNEYTRVTLTFPILKYI